jgi:hypothetical protein
MTDKAILTWLMQEGGTAIRYRTATDLLGEAEVNRDHGRRAAELLASPMVRLWLDRVHEPGSNLASFHSSKPDAFENATAKLCDLGLRAGMAPLDACMAPYLARLNQQMAPGANCKGDQDPFHSFERVLVAARLAGMGYDMPALRRCLAARLETLYELARTGNHAIYIDQDTFGDYPNNAFRKKPLVDPRFNGRLPSIHDVYALAHLPGDTLPATTQRKVDTMVATVIDYILHPDYQALCKGYGIVRSGPRQYYSMGWSVHLPGYHGFDLDRGQAATLVQRLALMANFPVARDHPWFKDTLAHLESFRDAEGHYRFPAAYLRESSSGYWVTGAYMRLEDNRRRRIALTLDSTFRMATIHHLL